MVSRLTPVPLGWTVAGILAAAFVALLVLVISVLINETIEGRRHVDSVDRRLADLEREWLYERGRWQNPGD